MNSFPLLRSHCSTTKGTNNYCGCLTRLSLTETAFADLNATCIQGLGSSCPPSLQTHMQFSKVESMKHSQTINCISSTLFFGWFMPLQHPAASTLVAIFSFRVSWVSLQEAVFWADCKTACQHLAAMPFVLLTHLLSVHAGAEDICKIALAILTI